MTTLVVYTTGPQEQALATLRIGAPAQALGWRIILGKEGVGTVYPQRVHEADIVLLHRDFPRFYTPYRQVLAEAHMAGKPVIYDIDDLLLALPPDHPNRGDYEDTLGGMAHVLMTADHVIVSTPMLRNVLQPFQSQITVWPTVLPDEMWSLKPPQPAAQNTPLILGYMGGQSHTPDIETIVPVLQRVLENRQLQVQIHFWGCTPPAGLEAFSQAVYHHPGVPDYAGFAAEFSANAFADIWLAPLKPGLFTRCKSAIKFWEYSAVGGAGIYSRAEPYTAIVHDGENGLLADTPDEWYAAIERLVADHNLRLHLAQNAQQTLITQGMLSSHLSAWHEIYTSTTPRVRDMESEALLIQAMLRFSEQVQQRAEERHYEILQLIQQIRSYQIPVLLDRSEQLDQILQSRWWRTWQKLKKVARFDFSSLPPHHPFQILDANTLSLQDDSLH